MHSISAALLGGALAVASATEYDCSAPIAGVLDVVLPFAATFDQANAQYSTFMGGDESFLAPDLVAMCADEDEVVSAVNWARECDYKVSIRSGGHSYAGYSSCGPWYNESSANGCMVVDVSQLEHYEIDEEAKQATFGVGWVLTDMLEILDEYDWVIPAGVCAQVGVGGHFQTSAVGFVSKSFGSGMDTVSSFRIVDAQGQIRDVSNSSDAKLYWAVLGGGAGSWGVVLDYTFDVIEAADYPHSEVRRYSFPYTPEIFKAVTNAFLEVQSKPEIARDMTSVLDVSVPQNLHLLGNYTLVITVVTVWTGIDEGAFTDAHYDALIKPIVDAGGTFLSSTFLELQLPLDKILRTFSVEYNKSPYHYQIAVKQSKQQLNPYFGPDFAEVTASMIAESLSHDDMFASLQINVVGSAHGSQLSLNSGMNALTMRDTVIAADTWIFYANPDDSDTAADLLDSYIDELDVLYPTPDNSAQNCFMTPRTTSADVDVMEDDWRDWFPTRTMYNTLRRIKRRVDSADIFSSAMTIPTDWFAY